MPHSVLQGLYSLWQYKVYAGIRRGSLEKRHQTTVGWRIMYIVHVPRSHAGSCVRHKLAGSSDILFEGDRYSCRLLRR